MVWGGNPAVTLYLEKSKFPVRYPSRSKSSLWDTWVESSRKLSRQRAISLWILFDVMKLDGFYLGMRKEV